MSTSFHLCGPDDLDRLTALALRRAEEQGAPADPNHMRDGLTPLTTGGHQGAAYLIGPLKAPVGYIALTFGWSVDLAAPEAQVVDLYIRPSIRRRGLASEAVSGVARALRDGGIAAIHFDLPADDPALSGLARKCGLMPRTGTIRATRRL